MITHPSQHMVELLQRSDGTKIINKKKAKNKKSQKTKNLRMPFKQAPQKSTNNKTHLGKLGVETKILPSYTNIQNQDD